MRHLYAKLCLMIFTKNGHPTMLNYSEQNLSGRPRGSCMCTACVFITCTSHPHTHTHTGGSTLSAKGLYRLHQFSKVELFGVTSQESGRESVESLEDMLRVQKEILSSLHGTPLHARYVYMHCTRTCCYSN